MTTTEICDRIIALDKTLADAPHGAKVGAAVELANFAKRHGPPLAAKLLAAIDALEAADRLLSICTFDAPEDLADIELIRKTLPKGRRVASCKSNPTTGGDT